MSTFQENKTQLNNALRQRVATPEGSDRYFKKNTIIILSTDEIFVGQKGMLFQL